MSAKVRDRCNQRRSGKEHGISQSLQRVPVVSGELITQAGSLSGSSFLLVMPQALRAYPDTLRSPRLSFSPPSPFLCSTSLRDESSKRAGLAPKVQWPRRLSVGRGGGPAAVKTRFLGPVLAHGVDALESPMSLYVLKLGDRPAERPPVPSSTCPAAATLYLACKASGGSRTDSGSQG